MKITGTMTHTLIVCMALALTAQHASAISDRAAANVDRKARAAAGAAPHVAPGAGAGHHAGAAPGAAPHVAPGAGAAPHAGAAHVSDAKIQKMTQPNEVLNALGLPTSVLNKAAVADLRAQNIVPNAMNMGAHAILHRLNKTRLLSTPLPKNGLTYFDAALHFFNNGQGTTVTSSQLKKWRKSQPAQTKESKRH